MPQAVSVSTQDSEVVWFEDTITEETKYEETSRPGGHQQ